MRSQEDRQTRDFFVELADAGAVDSLELAAAVKRLPPCAWVTTSDLATALGVSLQTVQGYIACGELRAMNYGTREQPRYKILRERVLEFLRGRFTA